jgi:DNA replication protein DnaC
MTQGFVLASPIDTDGKGLLFTSTIGVGKTHPAVGMLRELIAEKRCWPRILNRIAQPM